MNQDIYTDLICTWINQNPSVLPPQPITAKDFKKLLSSVGIVVKLDEKINLEIPLTSDTVYINYYRLVTTYSDIFNDVDEYTKEVINTFYFLDNYLDVDNVEELKSKYKWHILEQLYSIEYNIPYKFLLDCVDLWENDYFNKVDWELLFKTLV